MRRLLPFLLIATACSSGPKVNKFPPVRSPSGAAAMVARGHARFRAELLTVTDTALLLLDTDSQRIVLAPYGAFTRVTFPALPWDVQRGHPPTERMRGQLRLWSRYPGGVDTALLPRLLSAYGQRSLVVLAPCSSRDC